MQNHSESINKKLIAVPVISALLLLAAGAWRYLSMVSLSVGGFLLFAFIRIAQWYKSRRDNKTYTALEKKPQSRGQTFLRWANAITYGIGTLCAMVLLVLFVQQTTVLNYFVNKYAVDAGSLLWGVDLTALTLFVVSMGCWMLLEEGQSGGVMKGAQGENAALPDPLLPDPRVFEATTTILTATSGNNNTVHSRSSVVHTPPSSPLIPVMHAPSTVPTHPIPPPDTSESGYAPSSPLSGCGNTPSSTLSGVTSPQGIVWSPNPINTPQQASTSPGVEVVQTPNSDHESMRRDLEAQAWQAHSLM